MTAVAKHRTVSGGFRNEREIVRVTYDFSVDGGATGALDLFTASGALLVVGFFAYIRTACTSGGSATVIVGVTGDTDKMVTLTEGAVANLTIGAVIKALPTIALSEGTPNTAVLALPLPHKMADGEKALMTIGTAALTAGVIDFEFEIMRVS